MSIKKHAIVVMLALGVSGCEDKSSYQYLVKHPIELKVRFDDCNTAVNMTSAQTKDCAVVMDAARLVSTLLNEAQQDPEQFGQKILDEQIKLGELKKAYQMSKAEYEKLAASHADAGVLKDAQEKRDAALKNYKELRLEVKAMLGIIGMNTPG